MPATWRQYGTDANKDGKKDPYNPVDAIFAAARYLKAAGYEEDVRRSIFAYNHADWYVDSVMLRARLIAGVPADLVGSLTGLTEGRFPVAARARYADDLKEQKVKKAKAGQNAANVVESRTTAARSRSSPRRAPRWCPPTTARSRRSAVSQEARPLRDRPGRVRQPLHLRGPGLGGQDLRRPAPRRGRARRVRQGAEGQPGPQGPLPHAAASAGRQPEQAAEVPPPRAARAPSAARRPEAAVKERLFAHPAMPGARDNGGSDQLLEMQSKGVSTYDGYARPVKLDTKRFKLRRLKVGAQVMAGAPLGTVGQPDGGEGRPPAVRHPPRRQGRPVDRPQAHPGRLEAAGGHLDLPRLGPQRAARQRGRLLDRADHPDAQGRAPEARAGRPADRASTPAAARTSAPARSTAACWPPWPTWPSPASSPPSPR